MARIRTIKPEFFTSEDICALTPLARLFFQACWCEADREGRMEWKPRTMKLRYFPADDCDIEAIAAEVVDRGLVLLYTAAGKSYAVIPTFTSHQSVNPREQASKIPEPDASVTRADASNLDVNAQRGREGNNIPSSLRSDETAGAVDPAADDLKPILFGKALDWLSDHTDKPRDSLRGMVGKWCSQFGDGAALDAIRAASKAGAVEPIGWINQHLAQRVGNPRASPTKNGFVALMQTGDFP